VNEDEIEGAVARVEHRKLIPEGNSHLGDPVIDRRIALKLMLR
jgi:hypothetical protein